MAEVVLRPARFARGDRRMRVTGTGGALLGAVAYLVWAVGRVGWSESLPLIGGTVIATLVGLATLTVLVSQRVRLTIADDRVAYRYVLHTRTVSRGSTTRVAAARLTMGASPLGVPYLVLSDGRDGLLVNLGLWSAEDLTTIERRLRPAGLADLDRVPPQPATEVARAFPGAVPFWMRRMWLVASLIVLVPLVVVAVVLLVVG